MINNFYKAFEDRFRGSRELIMERLAVYLPFVEMIKSIYPDANAIDLGCGRGEWLQLLQENGVTAHGVDSDEGMLENAKDFGLSVELGDAVGYLKSMSDASVSIVSGFHIVEHLPFEVLQELIKESLRVLKPAGLLIMETPNPENIRIATTNFYLDPTHVRPIPSQLLSFLPEFYGFARVKVLGLQEPTGLYAQDFITLANVLNGVSPDYAVIAQKNASADKLEMFDELFAKDYGLSLNALLGRFDKQIEDQERTIKDQERQIQELLNFKQRITNNKLYKLLRLMAGKQ